jgi:hypothetical protein
MGHDVVSGIFGNNLNVSRVVVEKHRERSLFERLWLRWESNIKMGLGKRINCI